ncbi:DUF4177 domain-containing protein [Ureibacillus yapensis]|uniref:DUF4177 domain-containing protein n=1 Tax=Ureibacillus yapensis TaxID=2304605 RepID=UPI0013141185|nr:DUF4177 domain-containing protein [Lysinibacillus yapensis]
MKKEYKTVYVYEKDVINDDFDKILNTWAEDGYTLHTIIPYILEGSTNGYTIIFEITVNHEN